MFSSMYRPSSVSFTRILCVLALLVGLVAAALPHRAGAQSPSESLEEAECNFESASDLNAECGYLTVPENRANTANGKKVRLYYAFIPSLSESPAQPVIYLAGGPGGNGVEYTDWMDVIREQHPIILLDQRGTGYSEPSLNCREMEGLEDTGDTDPVQACRDRLVAEGVDLNAYNSRESAADLDALRRALEIESWTLYGISYGTRLALTALRDYPEGIESVVIDAVYPPQINGYEEQGPNTVKVFDTLFEGCRSNADCDSVFPNLRDTFYDTLKQLDAAPATYEKTDPNTGEKAETELTGGGLVDLIFMAMYDTTLIPSLPAAIAAAADGDFARMDSLLSAAEGEGTRRQSPDEDLTDSEGMNLSVECHEEMPFNSLEKAIVLLQPAPDAIRQKLIDDIQSNFDQCTIWDVTPADAIENEPVQSDIPVLVLNGLYDPITPPAWGKIAADALSNAYNYDFPGVGHGAIGTSDCANGIVMAFLTDPGAEPDGACIAELPEPDFQTR